MQTLTVLLICLYVFHTASATITPPTAKQTAAPTAKQTAAPTAKQTAAPTAKQTAAPTAKQTAAPTAKQTAATTAKQTAAPTAKQTAATTAKQTAAPAAGATATTQSPLACNSNGTLTYTGIPAWVQSAATTCGTATVDQPSQTIMIKGCTVGQTATVFMYSMPTTPLLKTILKENGTQVNVIAISCTYTADGEYRVTMTFPGSVVPTPFTAMESIALTMSLTNSDGTDIHDKVVIGEKYSLHINGGGSHYMKIVSCRADVNTAMQHPVPVYNSANDGANKIGIIDTPVPDTEHSAGVHPLKATLTGFRLVKSTTVALECTVKLCDKPNCSTTKRKRMKSEVRTAGLQFEVVGTKAAIPVNSAREIHTAVTFTGIFVMAVIARYLSL